MIPESPPIVRPLRYSKRHLFVVAVVGLFALINFGSDIKSTLTVKAGPILANSFIQDKISPPLTRFAAEGVVYGNTSIAPVLTQYSAERLIFRNDSIARAVETDQPCCCVGRSSSGEPPLCWCVKVLWSPVNEILICSLL
jgi:hypothetical protein